MVAATLTRDFMFCSISPKRNFFGNFDCSFRKCFTKGFFLTKYEEFRNVGLTANSRYLQTAALKYKASKGIVVVHVDHLRGHPDHILFFFLLYLT